MRQLNQLGIIGMKGKHHSSNTIRKIISSNKIALKKFYSTPMGRKRIKEISIEKKGHIPWNKGKQMNEEYRKRNSGEKHYYWKGGVTPLYKKIRKSVEYNLWRKAVFERDNYTCIWCGETGGRLNADHIKPFSDYPELRFAIDNGRTLCEDCHKKTATWGFNMKNYRQKGNGREFRKKFYDIGFRH